MADQKAFEPADFEWFVDAVAYIAHNSEILPTHPVFIRPGRNGGYEVRYCSSQFRIGVIYASVKPGMNWTASID